MPRVNSLASLRKSLTTRHPDKLKISDSQETVFNADNIPMILLPYQQKWVEDKSKIRICQKSRRIGISWAEAGLSALEASKINGSDTFYIGFNSVMSKTFIQDVAEWSKAYNLVASEVQETVLNGDDDGIIAYSVRFASGHVVEALSSKPRSLRSKGRPGSRLVIDEFAFTDDPEGLLKAAIAISIWGCSISIISTHNGKNSYFNQLIEQVKSGEKPFSLHTYTIYDALNDGLYKRICLINGEEWSKEKEDQWVANLFKEYGIAANEELLCIPSDYDTVKFFDRNWIKVVNQYEVPPIDFFCRAWDIAATERDLDNGKDPANTSGTLMGYSTSADVFVIFDNVAEAFNPAGVDRLMLETAKKDGPMIPITSELDPGSAGIHHVEHIKTLLNEYLYTPFKITGSKLLRAKNFASAAKNGKIWALRGEWLEPYLEELDMVPHGKMDRLDSSATAFNFLHDKENVIMKMLAYFS